KFTAVLVSYYFSKGMVDKAESICRENPKNTDACIALGSMYEQKKNYNKAIIIYEETLKNNPQSWDAANNLAFLLAETDGTPYTLQRAFELAQKALSINPQSPYIQDTLGWIEYKRGDISTAAKNIEAAVKKIPEHPVINYHMGVIYHSMGKTSEAQKMLNKAVNSSLDFQGKDDAKRLLDLIK
ncbi:MAG: tetratricopeptide repeat protein, partial [Desulfamplus sp.]